MHCPMALSEEIGRVYSQAKELYDCNQHGRSFSMMISADPVVTLIRLLVIMNNNSSNLLQLQFHAYYMTCPQP